MSKPQALVLCGDGINCDAETQFALGQCGFDARREHISSLLKAPERLRDTKLLVLPGGFSFGDEIASGKVLAVKIKHHIKDLFYDYIGRGSLLLGICNGFQVLTQMGLLPDSSVSAMPSVSLAHNKDGKFIDRWVELEAAESGSPFFRSLKRIWLPARHGEGRLVAAKDAEDAVRKQAVLRYLEDLNGSFDRIAGLTNEGGNVCGLMPHPEAFVRWTQHPAWTSMNNDEKDAVPHGLAILKNVFDSLN